MFSETLELELQEIKTGRVLTVEVNLLTMSMKTSLDEWLRYRFMSRATKEGESVAESERMAEGLDIFANNWFMPESEYMPRVMWELTKPGMSYSTFQKTYYEIDLYELKDKTEQFKRYNGNFEAIKQAMEFAMKNPTSAEKKEKKKKE